MCKRNVYSILKVHLVLTSAAVTKTQEPEEVVKTVKDDNLLRMAW